MGTLGKVNIAIKTAINSVASGLISKITGGKFVNGAMSAAFVHMFNQMMDTITLLTLYPSKYTEYQNTMITVNRMDHISYKVGFIAASLDRIKLPITKFYAKIFGNISDAATVYKHVSLINIGKPDYAGMVLDIAASTNGKNETEQFLFQQILNKTREKALEDFNGSQ